MLNYSKQLPISISLLQYRIAPLKCTIVNNSFSNKLNYRCQRQNLQKRNLKFKHNEYLCFKVRKVKLKQDKTKLRFKLASYKARRDRASRHFIFSLRKRWRFPGRCDAIKCTLYGTLLCHLLCNQIVLVNEWQWEEGATTQQDSLMNCVCLNYMAGTMTRNTYIASKRHKSRNDSEKNRNKINNLL